MHYPLIHITDPLNAASIRSAPYGTLIHKLFEMKRFAFIVILLVITGIVNAQERDTLKPAKPASIKLIGRYKDGRIDLRWYPLSAGLWRTANKTGYVVEKMETRPDGTITPFRPVGRGIFKPVSREEWSRTDTSNDYIRALGEALYTPPRISPREQMARIAEYTNEENGVFFTYILSTNLSAEAATLAGVRFTDKEVITGGTYAYRIYIPGMDTAYRQDTAVILVETVPVRSASPYGFRLEEDEGAVRLFWDHQVNRESFVGYHVERSADGGRTFRRLNRTPVIFPVREANEVSFTDSVKNYVPYKYRIVGITGFSDTSAATYALDGMGRDRTPASPPANAAGRGNRDKIVVTWELPYRSEDLSGFIVGRGADATGPFHVLHDTVLAIKDRMFIDRQPLAREPYYVVYSVDTAGNKATVYPFVADVYDTVGPRQPRGLTGTIDTLGRVMISWRANSDDDFRGYQVYRATGRNNVYQQLTGYARRDTAFIDTVNMRSLTSAVYYKITAIDYNNNASAYSEILELKRPDVIPPAAPLITAYTVTGNRVALEWVRSASTDVSRYSVRRTSADGTTATFVLRNAGDSIQGHFVDSTAAEGQAYNYELVAVDGAGHATASGPLAVTIAEAAVKPGVQRFTGQWQADAKIARLAWYFTERNEHELVLFREAGDGGWRYYKKLGAGKTSFEEPLTAGSYRYAIKVVYANGAESALSDAVTVNAQ